jgi:hypothetical protein
MKPHSGRIELTECDRVTQVFKEKTRVLGDAIEGKRFDPQAGFFGGAVTSRFGGAQFVITPEKTFYAGCVACPVGGVPDSVRKRCCC